MVVLLANNCDSDEESTLLVENNNTEIRSCSDSKVEPINKPLSPKTNKKPITVNRSVSMDIRVITSPVERVRSIERASSMDRDIECNINSRSPTITKKSSEDEQKQQPLKLFHPVLLRIPMQIRFGISGTLSNLIFVLLYNYSVPRLDPYMATSTTYSIVYLLLIPVSHALNNLLVFGWPLQYIKSFLSNFPIGLSAIVIGALGTAYLDRIRFEAIADDFVRRFQQQHSQEAVKEQELGEFYSSLVIMTVTGIWTYVISVMVNVSSEPHQKEL